MHSSEKSILRILLLLAALSLLVAAGIDKTANDFLVEGLGDVEPAFASFEGKMYSGLLPVATNSNSDSAEYMFWLFVPDQPSVPDTMITWLNGGPGCSSILGGGLLENSPVHMGSHPSGTCCLDSNAPLRPNSYSWTKATVMLYVEMPTGVGFSRGGKEPQNEKDVGKDMYGFMQSFYTVFPELLGHRLSLFGESYAGYFVPSIAHRIATENDKNEAIHVPLEGIALGNGWMDAAIQGEAVIDYAWWHGMIDAYTRDAFHAQWKRCYEDKEDVEAPFHAFTTPDECGIMEAILEASGKDVLPDGQSPNTYDITSFDPYDVISNPDSTLVRFMNDPEVKEKMHAPKDVRWAGCMEGAGRRKGRRLGMLEHDTPESAVPYVAELLDRWNLRVLVYNGDLDMSTNAAGSEMLLNNMQWSGHNAWKIAGRGIWLTKQAVAGYVKKYSNLTFLVVKNSGHLVPYNQPLAALDLVERYLRNVPFLNIPLPSFVLSKSPSEIQMELAESEDPQESEDKKECVGRVRSKLGLWILGQCAFAAVCFVAGAVVADNRRRRYQGYHSVRSATSASNVNGSHHHN